MKEIWKAVKGYEGLYEVSNTGKVRSLNYNRTGKVKELLRGNCGDYLFVSLCKEGKRKPFLIHRLVVQTFIGEIPKGLIVNHKDENKQNNNVDNLEIVTQKYNLNYGTRNERAGKKISAALKGKKRSLETCAKISATMKGNKNACKNN